MRRAFGGTILLCTLLSTGTPVLGQVSISFNDRLIQVAPSMSSTCQGLRDVLSGIDDASTSNRYLVRLEPGNFTCGSSTLIVPGWVTIEGSGPELTTISGTVDAPTLGVVHLLDGGTLRSLKVDNTLSSGANGGIAVSIFKLTGVTSNVFFDRVTLSAAFSGVNHPEILAIGANFGATNSLLGLSDLTNVSADYQYSRVGSAVGSGFTQHCRYCYDVLGTPVDASCN